MIIDSVLRIAMTGKSGQPNHPLPPTKIEHRGPGSRLAKDEKERARFKSARYDAIGM